MRAFGSSLPGKARHWLHGLPALAQQRMYRFIGVINRQAEIAQDGGRRTFAHAYAAGKADDPACDASGFLSLHSVSIILARAKRAVTSGRILAEKRFGRPDAPDAAACRAHRRSYGQALLTRDVFQKDRSSVAHRRYRPPSPFIGKESREVYSFTGRVGPLAIQTATKRRRIDVRSAVHLPGLRLGMIAP